MKKKVFYWLLAIALAIVVQNLFFPTYRQRERRYYADKDNFITVTATVKETKVFDGTQMCIYVADKSADFTDTGFVISDQNYEIALQKEIDTKLSAGTEIVFICAPRYFGDGYKIPIVALSVDGECLLEFEEGYANLMNSY